jgi:hypothetical protein
MTFVKWFTWFHFQDNFIKMIKSVRFKCVFYTLHFILFSFEGIPKLSIQIVLNLYMLFQKNFPSCLWTSSRTHNCLAFYWYKSLFIDLYFSILNFNIKFILKSVNLRSLNAIILYFLITLTWLSFVNFIIVDGFPAILSRCKFTT